MHPSETMCSFVIEEIILNILNGNILELANVTVIPMLNPDGVILGNYRTDLSGADLNRTFLETKQEQIETFELKKYV